MPCGCTPILIPCARCSTDVVHAGSADRAVVVALLEGTSRKSGGSLVCSRLLMKNGHLLEAVVVNDKRGHACVWKIAEPHLYDFLIHETLVCTLRRRIGDCRLPQAYTCATMCGRMRCIRLRGSALLAAHTLAWAMSFRHLRGRQASCATDKHDCRMKPRRHAAYLNVVVACIASPPSLRRRLRQKKRRGVDGHTLVLGNSRSRRNVKTPSRRQHRRRVLSFFCDPGMRVSKIRWGGGGHKL